MKLPWTKLKEQKKSLEEELNQLEQDKLKLEERFEAEQNRRKKLAKEKQEAEEERNKMRDKINSLKAQMGDGDKVNDGAQQEFRDITFEDVGKLLGKISSISSKEEDLLTVYSPQDISKIRDTKGLKNSIPKRQYREIEDQQGFVAFLDDQLGGFVLKMTAFFQDSFSVSDGFRIDELQDFMGSEKYWILASSGYTEIFREENGDYEKLEVVKSRVNREHSKGGFSQGRFQRKREEQVEGHFKDVREQIENLDLEEDKIYVLGDSKISKKLPGEYLGGFDPNRELPERFYKLKLKRF